MSEEQRLRDYLKKATGELRSANQRLRDLEARRHEPIAIVGVGCRYPGASSPARLWRLVESGADAISEFPVDRGWDLERLYDPDPDHPGTSYAREGGFLTGAGDFDAAFFGIGPREALAMDPQQRLLLEVAWEALEDGGIAPDSLRRSDTGTFVGVASSGYALLQGSSRELEGLRVTGNANSVASGRLSYVLGLEGPALTIDTACSSSLMAIHLACHDLREGRCGLALAGGATVMSTPELYVEFSRQRGLASDGRCKAFADAADGTSFSEGVGLVVLERLSEAERNGHRILATIRGSAVNQDGASNGLTAPNGPSQERVIRQALANAGLSASEVDAVEAHGTGTTLGDPIEAGALLATYGQDREAPLRLGSIKSNIGHTQAASGVAGVIKMVLAMRHGVLPRTLHLDRPTAHVDWGSGKVELLAEAESWEANGRPRRAGVSSFGISGTNAHLILEEPPRETGGAAEGEDGSAGGGAAAPIALDPPPLLVSARGEDALREQASRLREWLAADPAPELTDAARTLATGRARLEHRAVVLGAGAEELAVGLGALAGDEPAPGLIRGRAVAPGKVAFLFTGQGAQHPGMGRDLHAASPVFAGALDEVCAEFDRHHDRPLAGLLFAAPDTPEAALLDRTQFTQPALFALEVALFRLVEAIGLRPDHLIGHSIGELAAAHAAGVLDLADACELVAARGALMGALPDGGAMVAIEAGEAEVREALRGHGDRVSVAAVNGPRAVVVSGEEDAVLELQERFAAEGRRTRRLAVSHAFHSALMEPMSAEFEAVAAKVTLSPPRIPIVSNLSGELLTDEQATDPTYWARQVREPVRFAAGIALLAARGTTAFLELGPDGALAAMAQGCLGPDAEGLATPILRRGRPEPAAVLGALARLHCHGVEIDWARLLPGAGHAELPTYPFQRRRYWIETPAPAGDASSLGLRPAEHPLLGVTVALADGSGCLLAGSVSPRKVPWLADHTVRGSAILPPGGFLELALRAGQEVGATAVEVLTVEAPLVLPEEREVQIQVSVAAPDGDRRRVAIHSRVDDADDPDAPWTRNAVGVLGPPAGAAGIVSVPAEWPPADTEPLEVDELYERLADRGVELGPSFRSIRAAWRSDEEFFAEVALDPGLRDEAIAFGLHPALLEAVTQAAASGGGGVHLAGEWRDVRLAPAVAELARVRVSPAEVGSALVAFDEDGGLVASFGSLVMAPVEEARLSDLHGGRRPESLYRLDWEPAAPSGRLDAEPEPIALSVLLDDRGEASFHAATEALAQLRAFLDAEPMAEGRLVLVTRGAVATGEEPADPAGAAIWGLVRSAQSEHPGRFGLIDLDDDPASADALPAALALVAEEPQLAIRAGETLVPRLARAEVDPEVVPSFDPERTVLISGGTGALGSFFARHLVEQRGARRLLLVGRRGIEAEGAAELVVDLEGMGATVTVTACDVADRRQVESLLAGIPAEHPLGAVIHAAGAVADSLLANLDPERLRAALAPKAAGAWNLHELTRGTELSHFILFGSGAGTLGPAAQANYAAANAFLDALAQRRRAEGLPATAIDWGVWDLEGGMTARLTGAARARLRRTGLVSITAETGVQLFGAALAAADPVVLAMPLERAALRSQARSGMLPAPLRSLVAIPRGRAGGGGALLRRLAEIPPVERVAVVEGIIRAEAAAVLGHASADDIEPTRAFSDLGFDSMGAVELRNRLERMTSLRLPTTLAFDYPTATATAAHLVEKLEGVDRKGVKVAPTRASVAADPIAIVGLACRLPGGVASPEELWGLLCAGEDAIGPFPTDRGWDLDHLHDPDPDHPGTTHVSEGGFLADAAGFDAAFFGIGPREALAMDPQQRLLLEASWEALEDAGIDPEELRGTETGVFAGISAADYILLGRGVEEVEGFRVTGSAASVLSGRVAYALGLEGPAMTIDTACSSSLVAMHQAIHALRSGECRTALAGGVSVLVTPGGFVEFSRQRGLSADGRCRSFAAQADGVGWAEGVGLVVLERLGDAERNGRRILATIRGSAVNQDGASNGLTAPNGPSQERVIRQALANAGLEPSDVDAVEAHGTGTTLGDPIEAGALLATYGQDREEPLRLGSIKSNIGHTQAAAGVAGVIKMVLAMRHGTLPRTLHLGEPTPHVDWDSGSVELLAEAEPWEPEDRPRRAGVSSFGISGTNAHLILEEGPRVGAVAAGEEGPMGDGKGAGFTPAPVALDPPPLLLSARGTEALAAGAGRLADHLGSHPDLDLRDAALTLARGRASLADRAAVVGEDREELVAGLRALAAGGPSPAVVTGRARGAAKVAFLLSGQGSQRPGMGAGLYEGSPVFARALEEVCEEMDPHLVDGPLLKILLAEEGSPEAALLDRTRITQPALFALEVALFRLVEASGLTPDHLIGHSIGELTAAHLAGALDLPDACALVAARGALMDALPEGGAMVAVEATEEEVAEAISSLRQGSLSIADPTSVVEIAAVNGPTSVVVSGEEEAALSFKALMEEKGHRTSRLTVSHAFHSSLMEPMLADFEEVARTLTFHPPKIPIVSGLTGLPMTDEEATDPAWWVRQVREPVRFGYAVSHLAEGGTTAFLELGPDGVLSAMARQTLDPEGTLAIPLLRRDRPEVGTLTAALAEAHCHGVGIDWASLLPGASHADLPTYPFRRRRYWLEPGRGTADLAAAGQADADHPLLAATVGLPGGGLLLTGRISLGDQPWLADHAVFDTVIVPGTAIAELALKAATELDCELEDLAHEAPLLLLEDEVMQVRVTVSPADEDGRRGVEIHSRPDDSAGLDWTRNASGHLVAPAADPTPVAPLDAWPPLDAEAIDVDFLYRTLEDLDYDYGPAFRGLTAAWRRGPELFAEMELGGGRGSDTGAFCVHPALLDVALQAVAALSQLDGSTDSEKGTRVPFSWSGVRLSSLGASTLRMRAIQTDGYGFELATFDGDGAPVIAVDRLVARPVRPEQLRRDGAVAQRSLFRRAWIEPPATAVNRPVATVTLGGPWPELVDAPHQPTPAALAASIEADGRAPDLAFWRLELGPDFSPVRAAHDCAGRALALLQEWLADERLADTRLAIVTESAVATRAGEPVSIAAAPVLGLVRSAQTEHPGRFVLVDLDTEASSIAAVTDALALDEEQIAIRAGKVLVPRLERAAPSPAAAPAAEGAPEGTTLISGGSGALGAAVARHLVADGGVEHLLLLSRRGENADGAKELREELEGLGAEVTIAACDVADAARLADLLAEHPVRAVIHCAAVLDDGVVEALGAEHLGEVLAPKVDGAWNLHEQTRDLDLGSFVLFSSAAAVLGSPGQANYAGGNAFLDALAEQRHAEGLPALSLAWGPWSSAEGMAGKLDPAARARIAGGGLEPLSTVDALALFDAAREFDEPFLAPVRLDRLLAGQASRQERLPAILRGLVRPGRAGPAAAAGSLGRRLAELPEEERRAMVLVLVREEVAAVLGHASAAEVDPQSPFSDLGFDSLGAVELRNRLDRRTGLRLPATLVFDYPTADAVVDHVYGELRGIAVRPTLTVARQAARSGEPIAIVGMGCRFPGAVSSPAGLWSLLERGGDGIGGFPRDRGWDLDGLFHPDPDHEGTTYATSGGFVADAAGFDADFFGISPREALPMDPQQRLLLEVAWEALEEGGIDPASLRGSEAGVFSGVMYQDYGTWAGGPKGLSTGVAGSVVTGRVAYALGLEGPAITVDTACSSSLVAIHQAANALRQGECELALAGGVTVLSTPDCFIGFSRARGLAPDGHCKSFAAAADGTGWSEGAGLVVLERLGDAQRNGHRILATIRGSAVNQDGASNGLTAPNGPSQERVIRQALANAGLEPKDVDAVEAHGTGTTLGDPIEAGALLATYGQDREEPLRLGSIKSNIGHTQAAAGVAGVIKMVLAMRHGVLPRTLYAEEPTPHVDWAAGSIALLSEPQSWEVNGHRRRAGVSSFGIGGTNAHIVLEEGPEPPSLEPDRPEPPIALDPPPLLLSARGTEALAAGAGRLADHLDSHPGLDLRDAALTLARGRASLADRAAVVGGDREELLSGLRSLAASEPSPAVTTGRAGGAAKVAFLLSGQGSQRPGMGADLYDSSPVFARALEEVCEEIDPHLEDGPLLEILLAEDGSPEAALLDRTRITQPALFALEVALFRLVEALGLRPDHLIGHSIGELSAAHLAGVLDLPDACALVAARGALMDALPEGGAMVAVETTEGEVAEAISAQEDRLSIAAVNGPTSVVVSGEEEAVLSFKALMEEGDHRTSRLTVSHAFHSPLMEPMLPEFEEVAGTLTFHPPRIPIVSGLTGLPMSDEEATDPSWWVRQVREPVRFADAVSHLAEGGTTVFLELGPDGVLSAMARGSLDPEGTLAIPLLRNGRPEARTFTAALAEAHLRGVGIDWPALLPGARHADLPTYPFRRRRYWLEPGKGTADLAAAGQADAGHPLLAAAVGLPGGGLLLTGRISTADHPWLADHALAGTPILPGTAFLELALRAARELGSPGIAELILERPLPLPEDAALALRVTVSAVGEDGTRAVEIHSRTGEEDAEEWARNATGTLAAEGEEDWARDPNGTLAAEGEGLVGVDLVDPGTAVGSPGGPAGTGIWPPEGAEALEFSDLYEDLAARGLDYGPAFQGLRRAWRLGGEILAEVELEQTGREAASSFAVHPALLDAALHAGLLIDEGEEGQARLPFSFTGVAVAAPGTYSLRVRLSATGEGEGSVTLRTFTEEGSPAVTIASLATRPADPARTGEARTRDSLFELTWVPVRETADGGGAVDPSTSADRPPVNFHHLGRGEGADLAAVAFHRVGRGEGTDLSAGSHRVGRGNGADPSTRFHHVGRGNGPDSDPAASAREAVSETLAVMQEHLAGEGEASRLAIITENAVATIPGDSPDPVAAAVAGLVRSAQSEHPGRLLLIDTDGTQASEAALEGALASEEPQLAIRSGELTVPRLARVTADPEEAVAIDPDRTVLVTGGTGGLGSLVARHLVEAHGAGHLILTSRRGIEAPGAVELEAELRGMGVEVETAACDVADRGQLEALLDSIDPGRPLGAVLHAAGAIDDGLVTDLTPDRLDTVMDAKVRGAWNLHELTRDLDLTHLVLFSSVAATLGSPGQGNYAAANSFLDALAGRRRAEGLPATSIAWGLWDTEEGMGAGLGEVERGRLRRGGFLPLEPASGLRLLDAVAGGPRAWVMAAPVDFRAIRAGGRSGPGGLFASLVRMPARRKAESETLARRLERASDSERDAILDGVVLGEVAAVLGYPAGRRVDPERSFSDLGFDSLGAVELQNRLAELFAVRLAPTVVFDYPTPAALCEHVRGEVDPGRRSSDRDEGEAEIREALLSIPTEHLRRAGLLDSILALSRSESSGSVEDETNGSIDDLDLGGLVERALAQPEADGSPS